MKMLRKWNLLSLNSIKTSISLITKLDIVQRSSGFIRSQFKSTFMSYLEIFPVFHEVLPDVKFVICSNNIIRLISWYLILSFVEVGVYFSTLEMSNVSIVKGIYIFSRID